MAISPVKTKRIADRMAVIECRLGTATLFCRDFVSVCRW